MKKKASKHVNLTQPGATKPFRKLAGERVMGNNRQSHPGISNQPSPKEFTQAAKKG